MERKEVRILISGRVQGVGFRYFTKKSAESAGVTGWVKNLPSGKVEVRLQGENHNIDQVIEQLRKGPVSAVVRDLEIVSQNEDPDETRELFSIRR
jgi:acylphosphatase